MSKRVQIDSAKLRTDIDLYLKRTGKDKEAFAREAALSPTTIWRAETTNLASMNTLRNVAHITGIPGDAYLRASEESASTKSPVPNLEGEWEVYYVEDDTDNQPYIVQETAAIVQKERKVNGVYRCISHDKPEFHLEAEVFGNTIIGSYHVPDRSGGTSRGCFQLLTSKRDSEWLEGYCTWLDFDAGLVFCSLNVWIRNESRYSEKYRSDAHAMMEREVKMFASRRAQLVK